MNTQITSFHVSSNLLLQPTVVGMRSRLLYLEKLLYWLKEHSLLNL